MHVSTRTWQIPRRALSCASTLETNSNYPAFSRGQHIITVCARVRTPTTPPPAVELDLAAVEFKYVWASP